MTSGRAGRRCAPELSGTADALEGLAAVIERQLQQDSGLPHAYFEILVRLSEAPDRRLRMSELGQRTVLSRTRVSRVVDELAAAGLAERQPDQADGRSSFAALTPAGREALRRAWPVYRQAIHRQLTARLTPQQCRELAALLGLVIATDDLDPPVTISG